MKKKTATVKNRTPEIWVVRNYLWTILLGLPLVVRKGFFDITEMKTLWFVVWTTAFVVGRAVCVIQFSRTPPRLFGDAGSLAAAGMCAVVLFASAASGFFRDSLTGRTGRYQGAAMFWLYALAYFAASGAEFREKDVYVPLFAGFAACAFTTVANHLGWDLLGMAKKLIPFDRGRYISTLGNINFAGAYFSLTLPIAAWLLLRAEDWKKRWVPLLLCVGGLWAAMAVRSESAVLGLGSAVVLLPFTLKKDPKALRRWGLLLPGISLVMQAYRLIAAVWLDVMLSALTRVLLHPALSGGIALFGIGWYLLTGRTEEGKASVVLKRYAVLLCVCFVLGVTALVLLNTSLRHVPLGSMDSWLRFSDEWGTDRGKVWKYCLKLYGGFSLPDKLFGGGCGILALLDSTRRIFPDAVLDAAHSEYLQILLNWGVAGLLCYLVWIGSTLRAAFRSGKDLPLALSAGMLGYVFNAVSNIAQVPGIALFFTLMAVVHAASAPENDGVSQRK